MRAQIEIMGLMIIVIMISLLLFFGMVFLLDAEEPQRPIHKEFSDLQLIDNFGSSLRGAYSPCLRSSGFYTLGEVLDFCIMGEDTCNTEQNNCVYFNNTLLNLLESTFSTYGLDYAVNITSTNRQIFFNETNSCSSPRVSGYSTTLPSTISSGRRTFERVNMNIKVCP